MFTYILIGKQNKALVDSVMKNKNETMLVSPSGKKMRSPSGKLKPPGTVHR